MFGKYLLAALLTGATALASQAQDRHIAFVDLDKTFNEFYKTKIADAQLKEQAETFKADRKVLVDSFKQVQDEFDEMRDQSQNKALTEDVRNEKREAAEEKLVEIREQESKIRRFDESRQKQLDEQSRRMRNRLVDEIKVVVQDYARGENFSAVIDSSGSSLNGVSIIVYSDPVLDITPHIIETLNKGRATEPTTTLKLPAKE